MINSFNFENIAHLIRFTQMYKKDREYPVYSYNIANIYTYSNDTCTFSLKKHRLIIEINKCNKVFNNQNVPAFKRVFLTIGPRACDLFDASFARLSFAVFPAATLSVSTTNAIPDSHNSRERLFPILELVSLLLYVFGSNKRSHVP